MEKTPAAPGSIADVLARLELWCTRSDHGFIRITYDDGAARDQVVKRLEKALQGKVAAFHRLHLGPAATPQILAERLVSELKRLGPGVVSITGIEASLPPTAEATEAALRSLNAAREAFVVPEQHTLWWFPRHVSQALIREHHDLNSWFLKRTDLVETVASAEERRISERWQDAIRLKEAAQFEPAIHSVDSLLGEEEKRLGPNHRRVAVTLSNLAQLLQATNRLEEAELLMKRALEIDVANFGPRHPKVATRLNNLAHLLQETGRLSEAEPFYRRALEIDQLAYGTLHPDVATDLGNLASLLKATNRLEEAEPLMWRALEIDEASYGPQHPKVAIGLNNLALLFQETNRLVDAETLMRRALEIEEASYGSHHPNVACVLSNLATLLKKTKRSGDAEPLMRRALGIFARSLGWEHPNTRTVLTNFRHLLTAQNLPPDEIEKRVQEVLAEAGKK